MLVRINSLIYCRWCSWMLLQSGEGGEAFVASYLSRHTNHLCKKESKGIEQDRESALLYARFTGRQVQELLLFVCLKLPGVSQSSAMLGDVTRRSKWRTLKNLCFKQRRVGNFLWREMIKLFCAAVCLLPAFEYSSFIVCFPQTRQEVSGGSCGSFGIFGFQL